MYGQEWGTAGIILGMGSGSERLPCQDSKVHGVSMGPHVGPMILAIWVGYIITSFLIFWVFAQNDSWIVYAYAIIGYFGVLFVLPHIAVL